MSIVSGVPKQAIIAINDMLDNCARIKPGDEVLILANSEGLYGGDNLVTKTLSLGFSPPYKCAVLMRRFFG